MKNLLIPFFLVISILASAQIEDPKAKKHFDDGMVSYHAGLYDAADSLFELSFSVEPSLDAFFYKNISNREYEAMCKKCTDWLDKRSGGSLEKYYKKCKIADSIIYSDLTTKESISYVRLSMWFGDSIQAVQYGYCKKYLKDNSLSVFTIEPDSSNLELTNPIAHFPDLSKISSDRVVYHIVNEMPEFIGGDEARIKFLIENVIYPREAKESVISGTVYLTFIIDEQGNVEDVKILKSAHEYLDAEALRVTRLMPQWKPGKDNGTPVRIQFNMPMKFTLN